MTTDSDERPETWRPVAPMDGCTFCGYEASDKGRYRSIDRKVGNRQLKGKVLATRRSDDGYVLVNIRCDSTDPDHNRVHTFSGHKIVLHTFAGEPEPGQEACHCDRRARRSTGGPRVSGGTARPGITPTWWPLARRWCPPRSRAATTCSAAAW